MPGAVGIFVVASMRMARSFATLGRNWFLAFLTPVPLFGLVRLPRYILGWMRFSWLAGSARPKLIDSYPCLADRVAATPFDPHYFYQGAWLARRVAGARPSLHVDVASSALTMSVLSAVCPTLILDYRPLKVKLAGLTPIAGSVTSLPFADASLASLSCLHVIEHIGLGRYGDPLDPNGSLRAALELVRVLAPGGTLYLSVPIGRERVCFNAHRVFSPATILLWFSSLKLTYFGLVGDDGRYTESCKAVAGEGLQYGCGFFEFVRC